MSKALGTIPEGFIGAHGQERAKALGRGLRSRLLLNGERKSIEPLAERSEETYKLYSSSWDKVRGIGCHCGNAWPSA